MSQVSTSIFAATVALATAPSALAWSAVFDFSPASGVRRCTVKSGTPGQELVIRLMQFADGERAQVVTVLGTDPGTVAYLGWGEKRFASEPAAEFYTHFAEEDVPRIIELLTSAEEGPAVEWMHAEEGRHRGRLKVDGLGDAYGECLRRLNWWGPSDDHRAGPPEADEEPAAAEPDGE
jgi:hypothetical protein